MKRLALLPVCAVLTVRAWRWPYWFSVVTQVKAILQPPMKPETEADYTA